jgi:hypothetical protein
MPQITLAERLKSFNLDLGTANPADIDVPANQELVLDASNTQFKANLKYLEPKSLDDVKKWLGNPDEALAKPTVGVRTIASALSIAPSRAVATSMLPSAIIPVQPSYTQAESDDLHLLASAYVYGHSSSVDVKQKPALDSWIANLKVRIPVFVFNNINVAAGATLHVNISALFANYITVENTGRIKLRGGSKTSIHAAGFTGKGRQIVLHPGDVIRRPH